VEAVPYKEILSATAIALTFAAFVPYIRAILGGTTKPHLFSWIIWSITTFVIFLAQLEANGGVGAWPIGVSAVITMLIALLAYVERSDITITKTDRLFLVFALSALPLWYFTSDPLWTVVILTAVDVFGFGPTFRKAYADPYSEPLLFYYLFSIRDLLVIVALENRSVITVLFPTAMATSCLFLIAMMTLRRRVLAT